MIKKSISTIYNRQPILLYDCSLPLEERKAQVLEFDNGQAAARYLAVGAYRIYTHVKSRTKLYSAHHQKWFAVRYKKINNGNSTPFQVGTVRRQMAGVAHLSQG